MRHPSQLTQKLAISLLDYDEVTGAFTWKRREASLFINDGQCRAWNERHAGKTAGSNCNGYIRIDVLNKHYGAQQLAWLITYGYLPKLHIDHINGIKSDNRISNLRLSTVSQNNANRGKPANNTTGLKGVSFTKKTGKWRADITANRKNHYLGEFDCPAAASIAYVLASYRLFGEFTYGHKGAA